MSVHTTTGRWRLGVGLSLLTALLWGVGPIALKAVLSELDPYTIVWYRLLIAAGILSVFILRKRKRPSLKKLRGAVPWLLFIAIAGFSINQAIFLFGLDYITPSAATVVIQTAPVFLIIGGIVIFKESYSTRQFIGLAILLSGLVLFFNQRLGEIVSNLGDYTIGILLILVAGLLWAVYALCQKQLLKTFSSDTIMLMVYCGGALVFLPLAKPASAFEAGPVTIALIALCSLITVSSFGSFSEALDHLEISRISAILACIPLITIASMKIISALVPGFIQSEPLNALSIIGALLVVTGSMVSSLSRTP